MRPNSSLEGTRRGARRARPLRTAACAAALTAVALVGPAGSATAGPATAVSTAPVAAFQAAGDVGGGVLAPGTTYPPTTHGFATLKRGGDRVHVNIATVRSIPRGPRSTTSSSTTALHPRIRRRCTSRPTPSSGSCFEGANAVDLGAPFGIRCFDPQAVAHPRP